MDYAFKFVALPSSVKVANFGLVVLVAIDYERGLVLKSGSRLLPLAHDFGLVVNLKCFHIFILSAGRSAELVRAPAGN